jgi:hypothetical protein
VVRPALLWNDTRSAPMRKISLPSEAVPPAWADAVGSVPLAAFTVSKVHWMARNEPDNAAHGAAHAAARLRDLAARRLAPRKRPPIAGMPAARATGRPPRAPTGGIC